MVLFQDMEQGSALACLGQSDTSRSCGKIFPHLENYLSENQVSLQGFSPVKGIQL
jgi:hypothetical protein